MNVIASQSRDERFEPAGGISKRRQRTLDPAASDERPVSSAPALLTSSSTTALQSSGSHDDARFMRDQPDAVRSGLELDPWLSALNFLPQIGAGRLFYAAYAKRTIDVIVATTLLMLCIPVPMIAAIWIVADLPGKPLFCQKRIGREGKLFTLYKLRTMQRSTSHHLVSITDERGVVRHKIRDDPRVTWAGTWLRRTGIDELPQLWNVVRGDMSVVGPRPELPEIVTRYQRWQHPCHVVQSGLTGWWQVSGRSDLPMHEHPDLDLYYINRSSAGPDWSIVVKTMGVAFRGPGAF